MEKKEDNLKTLASTAISMNFVKRNNGEWNYQQWIDFCFSLEARGYFPIDLDQVGLMLESEKTELFAKNKGASEDSGIGVVVEENRLLESYAKC